MESLESRQEHGWLIFYLELFHSTRLIPPSCLLSNQPISLSWVFMFSACPNALTKSDPPPPSLTNIYIHLYTSFVLGCTSLAGQCSWPFFAEVRHRPPSSWHSPGRHLEPFLVPAFFSVSFLPGVSLYPFLKNPHDVTPTISWLFSSAGPC